MKLGDICEINMGQSPKSEYYNYDGQGLPFLQGNRTFGVKYPLFDTYTTFATKIAEAGDVIMSVRAPVGDVNITPIRMCLGRGVCGLHHKEGEQEFLYYLMRHYAYELVNRESGTVFGSVSRNNIANLEVEVPPLAEQVEIGRTLRALDDKIANNMKINNHLEQMAQAIYAQACPCDDSPTTPICDLIDVRDGTHDSPKAVEQGFPLVTSKHLLPYGVDRVSPNRISRADFDKINERSKVDRHDILISMIGTIGLISLVIEHDISFAIKNVGLFKTSQAADWVYFVLCFLRSPEIINHIDMRLAGSTQKYISLGELRQLPVVKPTDAALRDFNEAVSPLFEQITLRTEEIGHLTALRDALLPKLMSGELSVADVDIS